MPESRKALLVVARHAPYGSQLPRASLDLVLAAAAFEQDVTFLFLGDGVQQLRAEQDGQTLGTKSLARQLASLPLYDVDKVYADAQAAERLGVDTAAAPLLVEPLDTAGIRALFAAADQVLGF